MADRDQTLAYRGVLMPKPPAGQHRSVATTAMSPLRIGHSPIYMFSATDRGRLPIVSIERDSSSTAFGMSAGSLLNSAATSGR